MAYYSRNDSYSRSFNAELAETEGRFPRTRAAAKLGLSVPAFDAGCDAADYWPTEWHHVSKYANAVRFYDTAELAASSAFWIAAAGQYKAGGRKWQALMTRCDVALRQEREQRRADFREQLIGQRDCSRYVKRHQTYKNWWRFCEERDFSPAFGIGYPVAGDCDGIEKCIAEQQRRRAAQEASRAAATARRENEREQLIKFAAAWIQRGPACVEEFPDLRKYKEGRYRLNRETVVNRRGELSVANKIYKAATDRVAALDGPTASRPCVK